MGIVNIRNEIYHVLKEVGIQSVAYGFNQETKIYPRATFFEITTTPITASNNESQTNRNYQISLFFNILDEEMLDSIQFKLRKRGYFVDDWNDLSSYEVDSEIQHLTLEIEKIDDVNYDYSDCETDLTNYYTKEEIDNKFSVFLEQVQEYTNYVGNNAISIAKSYTNEQSKITLQQAKEYTNEEIKKITNNSIKSRND